MKSYSGSIDHKCCDIFEDKKLNLIFYTFLRKPFDVIQSRKPVYDGLFNNALTVGHREKCAAKGVSFYGKRIVFPYEIFPRQCHRSLVKLFKAFRAKRSELDEYSLGKSQMKITCEDCALIALIGDASVHRIYSFISERVYLLAKKLLKTKKTSRHQFKLHIFAHFLLFVYIIKQYKKNVNSAKKQITPTFSCLLCCYNNHHLAQFE